jgi:peroxiredoxin
MRLFLSLTLVFIYSVALSQTNADKLSEKSVRAKVDSMINARSQKPKSKQSAIVIGSQAPDFKTSLMDGTSIDLQSLKGKVVVLNFWFVACAPCRLEMPELNSLVDQFSGNGDVIFLAPAFDSIPSIKSFLKFSEFKYQILPSSKKTVISPYEIRNYPTNIVIGKDGTIKYLATGYMSGGIDNLTSILKKQIDEELAKPR